MEYGNMRWASEQHAKALADNRKSLRERPLAISSPPIAPEPMRVTTGYEELSHETTEKFFEETLDYLGIIKRARQHFTENKYYNLAIPYGNSGNDQSLIIPECSINLLVVRDIPVASNILTRDDANWIVSNWASYITPAVEEKVSKRLNMTDSYSLDF